MKSALASVARRQDGLFTRAQALASGYTPEEIRHRLAIGSWLRLTPGVYRVAGAPMTWRSRVWAALLAAGDGAVLSHAVAGRLWALDGTPAYDLFESRCR